MRLASRKRGKILLVIYFLHLQRFNYEVLWLNERRAGPLVAHWLTITHRFIYRVLWTQLFKRKVRAPFWWTDPRCNEEEAPTSFLEMVQIQNELYIVQYLTYGYWSQLLYPSKLHVCMEEIWRLNTAAILHQGLLIDLGMPINSILVGR